MEREATKFHVGFLSFHVVTYANYTTEIHQWLGFNIATQTVAGYIFVMVATYIMSKWAIAEHRCLEKVITTSLVCSCKIHCPHLYLERF